MDVKCLKINIYSVPVIALWYPEFILAKKYICLFMCYNHQKKI